MALDPVAAAGGRFARLIALQDSQESWSFGRLERESRPAEDLAGHSVALPAPMTVAGVANMLRLLRSRAMVLLADPRSPATLRAPEKHSRIERIGADGLGRIVVPTSGSTGEPKGVVHTWRSLMASAVGACGRLGFGPGDRWAATLSLHHVGGLALIFRSLASGGTTVFPSDPRALVAIASQATHLSLVSTQLRRLLDSWQGPPPKKLRCVLLGGSALPDTLLARGAERGWPLIKSYGLSEMGSLVTATESGDLGSSGTLLQERELRIVDGEIQVGGQALFEGYLGDGPVGPWLATGDLGYLDPLGRLHVTGRRDNMFISGGENIHPEQIERVLLALDGVWQAVVVPRADAEFGARPVAFVAGERSPEELEMAVREALPGFMRPVAFAEMPHRPEGTKPSRPELGRLAEEI